MRETHASSVLLEPSTIMESSVSNALLACLAQLKVRHHAHIAPSVHSVIIRIPHFAEVVVKVTLVGKARVNVGYQVKIGQ
jgi:hypothetical protein